MYVIDADFHDIFELSLGTSLAEIGVYVLWSDAAELRPSYVGEGRVVERIAAHLKDVDKPFISSRALAGRVALFQDGNLKQRKRDAEILECTLLHVADRLGIKPRHNRAPGKLGAIYGRGKGHEVLRVNVRGSHPLRRERVLSGTARMTWRWDDYEGWFLDEVPWRRV